MTQEKPELAHAYFIQDRINGEELARLRLQDEMVTTAMGGVLPEQPDPTIFHRVLDVACGPGNWLLTAAQTYPAITRLVGVDISLVMIKGSPPCGRKLLPLLFSVAIRPGGKWIESGRLGLLNG